MTLRVGEMYRGTFLGEPCWFGIRKIEYPAGTDPQLLNTEPVVHWKCMLFRRPRWLWFLSFGMSGDDGLGLFMRHYLRSQEPAKSATIRVPEIEVPWR